MARSYGSIQLELTQFAKSRGWPAPDFEILRGWINSALDDVLDRREWKGAEGSGTITVPAIHDDGTVTVTNGSNSITGSGTSWTAAMTGRLFRVSGRNETYEFTYVSGTAGTLSRVYEGDSDSGLAYDIFQVDFELAARARHVTQMTNPNLPEPMERLSEDDLAHISPALLHSGHPQFYVPAEDSGEPPSSELRQVKIYPPPEDTVTLTYKYARRPVEFTGANTSTELPPWVRDGAVIDCAKAKLCAHVGSLDGAMYYTREAEAAIARMVLAETQMQGPQRVRMADRYRRRRWAAGEAE